MRREDRLLLARRSDTQVRYGVGIQENPVLSKEMAGCLTMSLDDLRRRWGESYFLLIPIAPAYS